MHEFLYSLPSEFWKTLNKNKQKNEIGKIISDKRQLNEFNKESDGIN